MVLVEKVRNALISAGFTESEHESQGFELYSSLTDVILLHVQPEGNTEQAQQAQLERYQQALVSQFDVQILFPVLKIKEEQKENYGQ